MQSRKWCEISSVWESFAREDKKKANNKVKVFLLKLKKPLGHGWLKLKDQQSKHFKGILKLVLAEK